MEEKHIVAIEIGSSKLRGALGVIERNGTLNVVAVQDEPLAESVRYGKIRNVEEVASRIDAICRKLQNHASIAPRKIESVYVGIGGLSLGATTKNTEYSVGGEIEVDASIIARLAEQAAKSPSDGREVLTVLPREYSIDNHITLTPIGTIGSNVRATYSVIEAQPALRNAIERVIPERLGLKINRYIVSPLAQAEAVLHDDEKQLGCVFVDFGAETMTVAIYKGGTLRYLATLPIGSRNITRDLMSLNILEDRAEQIKMKSGNAMPAQAGEPRMTTHDGLDLSEANKYVAARASEIVANILAQVDYCGLKLTDLPAGFIIVGGGANLRGFSELLANKSRQKVRKGEILPSKVSVTDTSIQSANVIDVVALLLDAAANNPVECVEEIKRPAEPSHDALRTAAADDRSNNRRRLDERNRRDELDEADGSRIGRYIDEYDDEDDEDMFTPKGRNRKPEKEPRESKTGRLFGKLRERLANLIADDENDPNDE